MQDNEAFCFGCRQIVPIRSPQFVILKRSGAKAVKSICPICRTTVFKVLPKEHATKNKV